MYEIRQQEHFEPENPEDPLEPEQEPVALELEILIRSIDAWNATMGLYRNVHYAEVVPSPVESFVGDVANISLGNWVWRETSKIYRNPRTRQSISKVRQVRLRDAFTDLQIANIDPINSGLFSGRLSLQQWRNRMGDAVRDVNLAQYMFGRGGINAMTEDDVLAVTSLVNEQKRFLNNFAEDIRRGRLTEKQIRARAELYMESSSQSFERGKSMSFGIRLPQYPGDGNQICKARCRCHWSLQKTEGGVNGFWILDVRAAHCATCLRNSRDWDPLFVET